VSINTESFSDGISFNCDPFPGEVDLSPFSIEVLKVVGHLENLFGSFKITGDYFKEFDYLLSLIRLKKAVLKRCL
jgi:hypothetical protein